MLSLNLTPLVWWVDLQKMKINLFLFNFKQRWNFPSKWIEAWIRQTTKKKKKKLILWLSWSELMDGAEWAIFQSLSYCCIGSFIRMKAPKTYKSPLLWIHFFKNWWYYCFCKKKDWVTLWVVREQSLFTARGAVQISRGAKNLVQAFRGGNISVHRDLKALLKHLENTLKYFRRSLRGRSYSIQYTTFAHIL